MPKAAGIRFGFQANGRQISRHPDRLAGMVVCEKRSLRVAAFQQRAYPVRAKAAGFYFDGHEVDGVRFGIGRHCFILGCPLVMT